MLNLSIPFAYEYFTKEEMEIIHNSDKAVPCISNDRCWENEFSQESYLLRSRSTLIQWGLSKIA